MARFNPNRKRDVKRLRAAIRSSKRKLEPFREIRHKAIEEYAGKNYANGGSEGGLPVPVNLMEMAINIYGRQLVANNPRVMATTKKAALKPQAAAIEISTNDSIKEMDLSDALRDWVTDGLFGLGIMKVSEDRDGVFADVVDFSDWFHDMSATKIKAMTFAGHRRRVPLWEAKENEDYDPKARKQLKATHRSSTDETGNERIEDISLGSASYEDDYEDHVELLEIFLPQDNLIVTVPAERDDLVLEVKEWTGPEGGPFHFLRFMKVPGQLMPLSVAAISLDLHQLANNLFRKLSNQAKRQKTIGIVPDSNVKDAESIENAPDGTLVRSSNPGGTQEFSFGGIDQSNLAFFLQTKDLFSYVLGNLDSIGGLGAQSQTLGQDKLLGDAASKRMNDMQDVTVAATKKVVNAIAWHEWHNALLDRRVDRPVPFLEGKFVSADITAENREGELSDYDIDIDPYSMRDQSPGERLQSLQMVFQNYIVPFAAQMEQQGISIDFEGLLKLVAKLSGMKDLEDILIFINQPVELGGGSGEGSGKPSATHRVNERVNTPGATRQGHDQVMSQLLLGGNPQGSEMASLMRNAS